MPAAKFPVGSYGVLFSVVGAVSGCGEFVHDGGDLENVEDDEGDNADEMELAEFDDEVAKGKQFMMYYYSCYKNSPTLVYLDP